MDKTDQTMACSPQPNLEKEVILFGARPACPLPPAHHGPSELLLFAMLGPQCEDRRPDAQGSRRRVLGLGKGPSEQTLAGEAGFSLNKDQLLPTQGQYAGAARTMAAYGCQLCIPSSNSCQPKQLTQRLCSQTSQSPTLPLMGHKTRVAVEVSAFPSPISLSKRPSPL